MGEGGVFQLSLDGMTCYRLAWNKNLECCTDTRQKWAKKKTAKDHSLQSIFMKIYMILVDGGVI